jgi:hypothetical protein
VGDVAFVDAPEVRAASRASKLDPFKDEINRRLNDDPAIPGQRIAS